MRRIPHRWALGWLGASSACVVLSACSLVTSLSGLTDGEADGGGATGSSGIGTSSSSGGSTGGTGASSGGGSSSSGGGGSGSGGAGSSSGVLGPDASAEAGGSSGGATDDAGNVSADGGSSHDAGIKDAGTDTSVRDAAPSPFCASLSPAPLFCDDFDEGAIGTPWDQLATTSGSEMLSTASVKSGPYAMLVTVNPNAAVTAIDVAGYKSLTAKQGATGTATASFDIRINTADESSNSDAILGAIQLWNGSNYWDLELEVFYVSATHDFQVSMSEDGTSYVEHAISTHLALGTWTRVTLSIALPAGSGGATTATMAFDGTTVASQTVHVSPYNNPIPEVLIGTTYATPTASGWSVAYDDVTFDFR